MQDPFVSLGWFSPSQNLVLDEFASRYGIRECQRYLFLMLELLNRAETGVAIDPDLFHYAYSLCANYVMGKAHRDQTVHTVLSSERQQFNVVKTRITQLLERQITEFRYCFPFGRPEGALEKSLSLLERVLTSDNGVPASADLVRSVIQNCLRNAAVLNYERGPTRRLEEIIHLAELCIEVLQQNEEHHAQSFTWFSDLLVEHSENFWSLFQTDMQQTMVQLSEENWEVFHLFQVLNNYLCATHSLYHGPFHNYLVETFEPLVDRYISVMESSIMDALLRGIELETWLPANDPSMLYSHRDLMIV
ncbi:Ca -dependent secretion activator 2 [Cichlidogyrus casuarinus]|uniref:Ca -dependent secretion activator 2 n=1 Tax=Cichlidogyrus casuarinus TaxID=1844966 RepID=A0ABD2PRX1_9PLAT